MQILEVELDPPRVGDQPPEATVIERYREEHGEAPLAVPVLVPE